MTCAAGSVGVAGERSAGAAEAVVERDCGGERGEAAGEADAQLVQDAGAVAFEAEDVLGGEEDRFDALADRREVRSAALFVLAARAVNRGVERSEVGFELASAEVLVADDDQHLAGLAFAARDELQADALFVDLRRGQRQRPGGAVEREQRVQSEAPEEAAVAGAVAVVGGVGELAAARRLDAARALHRRGVDEHQLVVEAGLWRANSAIRPSI